MLSMGVVAKEKEFQREPLQQSSVDGDSLALTGRLSRGLHNYMEVVTEKLIRPIVRQGLPRYQVFNAFILLEVEVIERTMVRIEVNVNLVHGLIS